MLLASFVTGLIGTSGWQIRYTSPQQQDQALKIALSVQEAEKQEKFSESFYASFDNSLRQHSPRSSRRPSHGTRGSAEAKYTANQTNQHGYIPSIRDAARRVRYIHPVADYVHTRQIPRRRLHAAQSRRTFNHKMQHHHQWILLIPVLQCVNKLSRTKWFI